MAGPAARRSTGPARVRAGEGSRRTPTILLVDDHPIWRESLRRLLERKRAGTVVAEASDGDEALRLAASERPDIVIMDVDLPSIDGIEATRKIHAEIPEARVLFLSAMEGKSDVIAAIEAGASAYLLKTAGSSDVVDAVRRVHAGELVFPPSLREIVLEHLRRGGADPKREHERHESRASSEAAFVREGEFWTISYAGQTVRMKDSKGLRYIAELMRSPHRGIHAMELVAAHEGFDPAAAPRQQAAHPELQLDTAAAPSVLDPQARTAYRARLDELREQIEEAEQWHDSERAARGREEMDVLAAELARSVGLGGRDRKAASAAERARLNVTRAISAATKRIEAVHPSLGDHLVASVKTGTFCSYEPALPQPWRLQR